MLHSNYASFALSVGPIFAFAFIENILKDTL